MNHIETLLRNRLKTHTLDCLMRISIKGPPLSDFNFEKAADIWNGMRNRRLSVGVSFSFIFQFCITIINLVTSVLLFVLYMCINYNILQCGISKRVSKNVKNGLRINLCPPSVVQVVLLCGLVIPPLCEIFLLKVLTDLGKETFQVPQDHIKKLQEYL